MSASSECGEDAEILTDGETGESADHESCDDDDDPWVQIELEDMIAVSEVKIFNSCENDYTSLNGFSVWIHHSYNGYTKCGDIQNAPRCDYVTVSCHGNSGQEVYVEKDGGFAHFSEIEVYGQE